MLKDNLSLILAQIDNLADNRQKYQAVRQFFTIHEENLVSKIEEFSYLCELKNEFRYFVTYPTIGNWFLETLRNYTPNQRAGLEIKPLLEHIIKERRFNNQHLERYYNEPEVYNAAWDHLNDVMLAAPDEAMPFHDLLHSAVLEFGRIFEDLPRLASYSTGPGHGLIAPAANFGYLTFYLECAIEDKVTEPLNLTLMLVDDSKPREWYERLLRSGFAKHPTHPGYFKDCESALIALQEANYDVILTDIDLGEGNMNGLDFVDEAYQIQRRKGILPLISVFSYDREKLREADEMFYPKKVFHQVYYDGNKTEFRTAQFRNNVCAAIEKHKRFGST